MILKDDARRAVFQALQAKKQEKITHPFLGEEIAIGYFPMCKPCYWLGICVGIWQNIHRFLMR
ncbi:hypothetical protein [Moraxella ovis]|uniref:hypothetical protein n=1 Tax=Moraxella ovis TaxID=29433 RepID=UPI001C65CCB8|nr:hypothetical protein [Moraxella ovis]